MQQAIALSFLLFMCTTAPTLAEPVTKTQPAYPAPVYQQQHTRPGFHKKSSTLLAAASQAAATRSRKIEFVRKAAEEGLAQVKMGELAQRKSNNESVRQFGKKMVNEHLLTNEKLRVAASATGISVPETMSGMQRKSYDMLSRLAGSQFDAAYMQLQVSDYKSIVKYYKREAREESPSRVREFAVQTLLALEQHLTDAEDIKQRLLQQDKTS